MSGSYPDTAAETLAADAAAIAAEVGPAMAVFEAAQASAKAFVAEHGAAVNDGHGNIGYLPSYIAEGE